MLELQAGSPNQDDGCMAEQNSSWTGEAEIDQVFSLTTGRVLVLKNEFRGVIYRDGIVESDRGTAVYTGPEFLHSRELDAVAVIVGDEFKELFIPEQLVRFYRKH
jgi:hypothetical protein